MKGEVWLVLVERRRHSMQLCISLYYLQVPHYRLFGSAGCSSRISRFLLTGLAF